MEIIFHSHANKTHFQKKGCAPSLILKVGVFIQREVSAHVRDCGLQNPENFCLWNLESRKFILWNPNPGLWNPRYSSRNPDWNPESKFHWRRIRNPVPRIWNPRCWIQNPRLSLIPLHGTSGKYKRTWVSLSHYDFLPKSNSASATMVPWILR